MNMTRSKRAMWVLATVGVVASGGAIVAPEAAVALPSHKPGKTIYNLGTHIRTDAPRYAKAQTVHVQLFDLWPGRKVVVEYELVKRCNGRWIPTNYYGKKGLWGTLPTGPIRGAVYPSVRVPADGSVHFAIRGRQSKVMRKGIWRISSLEQGEGGWSNHYLGRGEVEIRKGC